MKNMILALGAFFCISLLLFAGHSFAEEFFGAKFMSLKEAKTKWGSTSFNAKNFKKSSEKEKGAMATQAVEEKVFVGQDMLKVREQMGDPDSYFFSDTIYAYMITSNVKPKQESWQLVFIPDEDLKKVKDVKIHKKCCYEKPEWAK